MLCCFFYTFAIFCLFNVYPLCDALIKSFKMRKTCWASVNDRLCSICLIPSPFFSSDLSTLLEMGVTSLRGNPLMVLVVVEAPLSQWKYALGFYCFRNFVADGLFRLPILIRDSEAWCLPRRRQVNDWLEHYRGPLRDDAWVAYLEFEKKREGKSFSLANF